MFQTTLPSASVQPHLVDTMTRRAALKRAALFLGVALSPALIANVLQAGAVPGGKAVFLSPAQLDLVTAIAERILPRTDTPGATDVGVPAFVDLMLGKYSTDTERQLFATGLDEVNAACLATHARAFVKVGAAQQDAILMEIALASQKKDKTFFHHIKELTVVGYFTSEIVGRTVLHYDPVPGRFQGCVPISEVGNVSWTK
ncbi:MAG: gluconate 2-dehydrogenase subunit 3 family protein [Opitutaceae bacterium]